jgi:hypothetical protein
MSALAGNPLARLAPFCAGSVLLAIFLTAPAYGQETSSFRSLSQTPNSPIPGLQYFSTNEEPEALPVRQRPRPDYNSKGIRGSSFLFFPDLTVKPFYDSNVFASPTGQKSDGGIVFSPSLFAQSDWNNHSLQFNFDLNHFQYFDLTDESRTDAQAVMVGRLDVRRDLAVLAAVSVGRRHETRGTSNSPLTAAEPVPYDEFDGSTSINKSFNRVDVSLGIAGEYRNYHDVGLIGGGQLDQDFRDGTWVEVGGRVAYLMKPGIRVFADARYNWRRYENLPGLNGDSEGYNLLGGLEFTLSTLMRGEVGIGYLNQTYDGAGIGDASGLKYKANLIWNATPLMTLTFNGERNVSETGIAGAAGRIDTSFEVVLDYELRRNVIVSPSVGFTHEDYAGIARADRVYQPALKIDYLINRNFSAGAEYAYTHRDSSVNANDFDRHFVSLNAQAKF